MERSVLEIPMKLLITTIRSRVPNWVLKISKGSWSYVPFLNKDKRDDDLLNSLYDKTLELWHDEMKHVKSLIGGYTIYSKGGSQEGDVFEPTLIDEQRRS